MVAKNVKVVSGIFATGSDGILLMQIITPANMHDATAAYTLVEFLLEMYPDI